MHLHLMGREPADVSKHSNNVGMQTHAGGGVHCGFKST